jgi:hypothetical protein
VLVGLALVVFYGFSFSFSASGGPEPYHTGWSAEAGYAVQSRFGLAGGAVLLVAGLFMEREGKKKAAK